MHERRIEWHTRLARAVAHRHDQRRPRRHLVVAARDGAAEVDAAARRGAHRLRVDAPARLAAGAGGGSARAQPPQPGRELRAGGVVRADEQDGATGRRRSRHGHESREDLVAEHDVAAAAVPLGHPPLHHTGCLERAEVVGGQVHRQAGDLGRSAGGQVAERERVDDHQPVRIREGGEDLRATVDVHVRDDISSIIIESIVTEMLTTPGASP